MVQCYMSSRPLLQWLPVGGFSLTMAWVFIPQTLTLSITNEGSICTADFSRHFPLAMEATPQTLANACYQPCWEYLHHRQRQTLPIPMAGVLTLQTLADTPHWHMSGQVFTSTQQLNAYLPTFGNLMFLVKLYSSSFTSIRAECSSDSLYI
jgi:hypothetical protein